MKGTNFKSAALAAFLALACSSSPPFAEGGRRGGASAVRKGAAPKKKVYLRRELNGKGGGQGVGKDGGDDYESDSTRDVAVTVVDPETEHDTGADVIVTVVDEGGGGNKKGLGHAKKAGAVEEEMHLAPYCEVGELVEWTEVDGSGYSADCTLTTVFLIAGEVQGKRIAGSCDVSCPCGSIKGTLANYGPGSCEMKMDGGSTGHEGHCFYHKAAKEYDDGAAGESEGADLVPPDGAFIEANEPSSSGPGEETLEEAPVDITQDHGHDHGGSSEGAGMPMSHSYSMDSDEEDQEDAAQDSLEDLADAMGDAEDAAYDAAEDAEEAAAEAYEDYHSHSYSSEEEDGLVEGTADATDAAGSGSGSGSRPWWNFWGHHDHDDTETADGGCHYATWPEFREDHGIEPIEWDDFAMDFGIVETTTWEEWTEANCNWWVDHVIDADTEGMGHWGHSHSYSDEDDQGEDHDVYESGVGSYSGDSYSSSLEGADSITDGVNSYSSSDSYSSYEDADAPFEDVTGTASPGSEGSTGAPPSTDNPSTGAPATTHTATTAAAATTASNTNAPTTPATTAQLATTAPATPVPTTAAPVPTTPAGAQTPPATPDAAMPLPGSTGSPGSDVMFAFDDPGFLCSSVGMRMCDQNNLVKLTNPKTGNPVDVPADCLDNPSNDPNNATGTGMFFEGMELICSWQGFCQYSHWEPGFVTACFDIKEGGGDNPCTKGPTVNNGDVYADCNPDETTTCLYRWCPNL